MIRFLNILALAAVIGSATWAYSVKYETILIAEKLKKRHAELQKERDAIQVLAAEWELLNRPARLAALAKPEVGMQQLSARQVVEPKQIPAPQPAKVDALDSLLTGSIPAPAAKPSSSAAAPKSAAPKPAASKAATPDAKAKAGKAKDTKATAAKPVAAPLPLAPKAGAKAVPPKAAAAAPKASAPKDTAPKASAPVRLAPSAPAAPAAREQGGLNSLFKKILN